MPQKSELEMENKADDLTLTPGETAETTTGSEAEVIVDESSSIAEPLSSDAIEITENEEPETAAKRYADSAEVLVALTELSQLPADEISREEVARLRQLFHNFQKSEAAATLEAATAADDVDPFALTPVSEEATKALEIFNGLIEQIKEKKTARAAEVEAELRQNFETKEALISEIITMSGDTDNVNRHFPRFREIQAQFKAIGEVDPRHTTEQWKRYQDAVELFYDQLKVNKDLRDYDFKKNLEAKEAIIAEAKTLSGVSDIVAAFRRLQELHNSWREIGPVAKEMRNDIWARFKEASAVINRNYQAFFEERKERENQFEAAKTALCEKIESIDLTALTGFNAWNEATDSVLKAQEEWKTLGFASKKVNSKLFARFREACDKFFEAKAAYYKGIKDDLHRNLELKTALADEAESLAQSTDWKATADKLTELQRRWREIGAVPKKHSDAVWRRFQTACDTFFRRKKEDLNEARSSQQVNLQAKRQLIADLAALPEDMPRQEVVAAIKAAQARWTEIGHVPFKDKETIYTEFRAVIDNLFATRDLRGRNDANNRFRSSIDEISDPSKLSRERERLARVLEQKRADLQAYQNNLGFFNFKSAQSSSMLKEIERKTRRIQDDIADLEQKISLIDSKK